MNNPDCLKVQRLLERVETAAMHGPRLQTAKTHESHLTTSQFSTIQLQLQKKKKLFKLSNETIKNK